MHLVHPETQPRSSRRKETWLAAKTGSRRRRCWISGERYASDTGDRGVRCQFEGEKGACWLVMMMTVASLIVVARKRASGEVGPSTISCSVRLCNSYSHGDSSTSGARWHSCHAASRCCSRNITCTAASGSIKQSGDSVGKGSAGNSITPSARLSEAEKRRSAGSWNQACWCEHRDHEHRAQDSLVLHTAGDLKCWSWDREAVQPCKGR